MTPPLWTRNELIKALACTTSGPAAEAMGGVSIDSRTVSAGDAFFAIRGDRFDGHDFVGKAVEAGASVAVVEKSKADDMPENAPLMLVDDVMQALRDLAAQARARTTAKMIAVTGSVGKTSTKDALRQVLTPSGTVHAANKSFNNHWGVPLTLARLPGNAAFGVFEIGMNHAGEITPLTKLVQPDVAIITSIAAAHLEFFDSIDAIARAKSEIFQGLVPGGVALINGDIAQTGLLLSEVEAAGVSRVVTFGEAKTADARLISCTPTSEGSTVTASILGTELTYTVGAPGRHMAMNSLAVLATVDLVGGHLRRAALAYAHVKAGSGRGEQCQIFLPSGEQATLIDESYNANPTSMVAAFELLGSTPPSGSGRRIAVLADMLELGPGSPELHAALSKPLTDSGVDLVLLAGSDMVALWRALPRSLRGACQPTSEELIPMLLETIAPGDVILVKGSNGSRTGLLADALKTLLARSGGPAVDSTEVGSAPDAPS